MVKQKEEKEKEEDIYIKYKIQNLSNQSGYLQVRELFPIDERIN